MILSSELIEEAFLVRAGTQISELVHQTRNRVPSLIDDKTFPLNYDQDTWFRFVVVTLKTGVSLATAAEEIVQNGFIPTRLEHLTVLSRDRPVLQHSNAIFATERIVQNSFQNDAFPMIDGGEGGRIALMHTSIKIQEAYRILCIHSS